MDYGVILAYIIGIIFLFILGRLLLIPMKIVLKLVYNALIGAVVLLIINFIGGFFNFHIALNAATALITGILGAPGIVLLIIMKYMFKV